MRDEYSMKDERMMKIRNSSDLKMAYEILLEIHKLVPLSGREEMVKSHIRQLKSDIRDFFRNQEKAEVRYTISDDGINGYTELIRLPESLRTREEAEPYFEENEIHHLRNFHGACAGKAYTCWYKIVYRQQKMWAYHRVSFDV